MSFFRKILPASSVEISTDKSIKREMSSSSSLGDESIELVELNSNEDIDLHDHVADAQVDNQSDRLESSKPLIKKKISADENFVEFTPRGFVAGYLDVPAGVNAMEAVGHASAIALETEKIRVIYKQTKTGVFFLACSAADFVNTPFARTELATALPGSTGHVGDGAYFTAMGSSGLVAVIIKEGNSLTSYVGDRADALRFAGSRATYWPSTSEPWVGLDEFESRHFRKIYKTVVLASVFLSFVFVGVFVTSEVVSARVGLKQEITLNKIRDEHQAAITQIALEDSSDAFAEYRKFAPLVNSMDGRILRFESSGTGAAIWEVEFPPWATNLSAFGADVKMRSEKGMVYANKGEFPK
jgi:hypothetical protein